MKIKHYINDIPDIEVEDGWKPCWYGLARVNESFSDKSWARFKLAEDEAHKLGYLGERELEVDLMLSILDDIKKESIVFVELGAGYADWCMAVNGVIKNKVVKIKEAQCFAVEAEPQHFEWAVKHFDKWKINGKVIQCAISDKNGWCDFALDKDASSNYGQSVTYSDALLRTASNLLRRKSISVPCYTLDALVAKYDIKHIDYIDMDIQGNELRAINGAMESIKNGMIDYWKIGTHAIKYNDKIKELLSPYYDLVLNVYPYSVGGVSGLKAKVEDGIQVYKRFNR